MHIGWLVRMPHKRWRRKKQFLIRWSNLTSHSCLVSIHVLSGILTSNPLDSYCLYITHSIHRPLLPKNKSTQTPIAYLPLTLFPPLCPVEDQNSRKYLSEERAQ